MSARDEVLGRIRAALAGTAPDSGTAHGRGTPAGRGAAHRDYRSHGELGHAALLDLLTERLTDYHANVRRAAPRDITDVVGAALAGRGARRLVVPPGLTLPGAPPGPAALPGVRLVVDDGLSPAELDTFDGVITGAAVAVAETGTIILDGSPGQGRRALTLIPDYHLCLVESAQVVALVPEAVARLAPGRPLTWISGPSATSDIELERVEGVHGPRTLEVILIVP